MTEQPRQPVPRALDWDEGAASERTVLAWERTAIASFAIAALVVRAGVVAGPLGLAIPTAVVLVLAGLGEWRFSRRIYAEHDQMHARGVVLHERALTSVWAATLIAALASTVLLLSSRA